MCIRDRLNPAAFEVADIYSTSICPLARVMRTELRKRGIPSLKVVYSKEKPLTPVDDMAASCRKNCICPVSYTHLNMIKEINLKDRTIKYNLQYKKVKNINLRIKSDGTVNVSANKNVPQKIIDDFMNSKADFILDVYKRQPSSSTVFSQ